MTSCDLCGKNATTKAKIEGVVMDVCASCASFGAEVKAQAAPPKIFAPRNPYAKFAEPEKIAVVDAGKRLRAARQKMNLNEEDAAKKLGMHKSTLLHYESGKLIPDEKAISKLEKFYGISLLE